MQPQPTIIRHLITLRKAIPGTCVTARKSAYATISRTRDFQGTGTREQHDNHSIPSQRMVFFRIPKGHSGTTVKYSEKSKSIASQLRADCSRPTNSSRFASRGGSSEALAVNAQHSSRLLKGKPGQQTQRPEVPHPSHSFGSFNSNTVPSFPVSKATAAHRGRSENNHQHRTSNHHSTTVAFGSYQTPPRALLHSTVLNAQPVQSALQPTVKIPVKVQRGISVLDSGGASLKLQHTTTAVTPAVRGTV